jgi:hypothetical protein
MAFSYTPQNAIDLCNAFTKNTPTSAMQIYACDMVSGQMWSAAPWQWTLQQISPTIALSNGVQDYSVPSEVFRFVHLRQTRTDVTTEDEIELDNVKWLPPQTNFTIAYQTIRLFCHELTLGKIRLQGAPSITGTVTLVLNGEYQANPVKITSSTLSTPLWIPDQYFNVFQAGVLYYFYKFTDDARAGGMVVNKSGMATYSGQYGVWMNELDRMAESEDLKTGNDFVYPSNTLGTQSGSFTIYPGP